MGGNCVEDFIFVMDRDICVIVLKIDLRFSKEKEFIRPCSPIKIKLSIYALSRPPNFNSFKINYDTVIRLCFRTKAEYLRHTYTDNIS